MKDTNNRYRFLVSSKTFRKYLKEVVKACFITEEYHFNMSQQVISLGDCHLPVTTKETGKFTVSFDSINRTIKALKHASDQPIVVEYEETWNCFNIRCCF